MQISARSYLTAGVSLTAATAIAFTPLMIPVDAVVAPPRPAASVADVRLVVSPADIAAFITDLRDVFDDATTSVADMAGIPGQTLIGVVDNIVALINTVFTGLIGSTDNQTIEALLTVLQTFSADAFEKLAENLRLANPVITTTVAQVGELLTGALTGSLQNIVIAVAKVVDDPFAFASYAGLVSSGVASSQQLAGNTLSMVRGVGDAGFDLAAIILSELTFQFNNAAINGLGALLTEVGDASGNAVIAAVLGAVQGLAIAPAVAVFNLGSGLAGTVLDTAGTGFDVVTQGLTSIVSSTGNAAQSAITAIGAGPLDPASYVTALASLVVGGFGGFEAGATTFGGLARLPLDFAAGVDATAASVVMSLNNAAAQSISGILGVASLPADIVAVPLTVAAGINGVVDDVSTVVGDSLDAAGDVIDDGVEVVLEASDDAEAATLKALGNPPIPVVESAPEPLVVDVPKEIEPSTDPVSPVEDVEVAPDDTVDEETGTDDTVDNNTVDEDGSAEENRQDDVATEADAGEADAGDAEGDKTADTDTDTDGGASSGTEG